METSTESLCRLCLKESKKVVSLFHYKNGHQICELVKIIIPIKIEKNENLPKNVCVDCLELIIDAIHLRDLSLMNDKELRRAQEPMGEVFVEALFEAELSEEEIENSKPQQYLEPASSSDVRKNYCEPCDMTFFNISSFKRHQIRRHSKVETSTSARKNYCEICDHTFSNTSSFKRHQLRKHSSAKYSCDLCGSVFKIKHDIDQHMRHQHILKYPEVKFLYSEKLTIDVVDMYEKVDEPIGLTCGFCAYSDLTEESLLVHMQQHQEVVESGKMYCLHCPMQIKTMEFFIEHTRSHNEKEVIKTHRCLICNKTFPFDDKFLNHLRNHKKNQHKICFCPECGRKFSKPKLMEDHIRFIHNKESLFCCPECGQGFGSKSALNGHIKRHIEGNKYQCPFCPRAFSSHNLLNSHKVIHSNDRPFACHLCDKRFKHQKVLGDHLKRHDGSRPVYICNICERSLNSAYALSRHMLTHSGSKPHQCEFCQKAYAQKNDLNKHLRTHVGENTYFCDFVGCDETFRILSDLRVHQGVHYIKPEVQLTQN